MATSSSGRRTDVQDATPDSAKFIDNASGREASYCHDVEDSSEEDISGERSSQNKQHQAETVTPPARPNLRGRHQEKCAAKENIHCSIANIQAQDSGVRGLRNRARPTLLRKSPTPGARASIPMLTISYGTRPKTGLNAGELGMNGYLINLPQ
ncbi:hypothetical protein FRB90_001727 [Tulasnella sp. 427]|nr:hypothetical protein FRB90_001727 [Tulasnella sp. 427]